VFFALFIFSFLFSFMFFIIMFCFAVAAGVVGTVGNCNEFSDRPFVGVGKFVGRVWAKRSLLCPCAVHGLVHAHKRLRSLNELRFSTVSITLSFELCFSIST